MLESLNINNFGIIEHVHLECARGLNVLTGETGAGKSILIDALRFALGERFHASQIRDGAELCLVEAVFVVAPDMIKAIPLLTDFPLEDDSLIIQRSVSHDGKSRVRINGLSATASQLKELGDHLIDLHGPHDHQLLLAEDKHLGILDALTNLEKIKTQYDALYKEYSEANKKILALEEMTSSRERDLDLLSHQIKELEQVPLDPVHYQNIEQDRIKINNAEKLFSHIEQVLASFENEDAGIETILSQAYKPLQNISQIDEKASAYLDRLTALQDESRELVSELRDYASSLDFDPERAKEINEQSDAYHSILKKYGPTLENAKDFFEDARKKFSLLSDFEHNEQSLQEEKNSLERALTSLAKKISSERNKSAASLKLTIETELKELGFQSVHFEARVTRGPLSSSGFDQVAFYISPNAGESLKPLAEIVSSGESARIMLAIKKALMKVDPVPVLIFDEIDAQIGGRLGTVIGTKLKEISSRRQVILITHLPQIAAFADQHAKIAKRVENGRTKAVITPLQEQKERIAELAQMMTGEKTTDIARQHAKDMLQQAQKDKR